MVPRDGKVPIDDGSLSMRQLNNSWAVSVTSTQAHRVWTPVPTVPTTPWKSTAAAVRQ